MKTSPEGLNSVFEQKEEKSQRNPHLGTLQNIGSQRQRENF